MHTHRIDVLDRADDDAVVGAVAHDLELVLLPTGDALLDEDLADRAGLQTVRSDTFELVEGRRDAGATTAQDVRGPDDARQADLGHHQARFVDGVRRAARRYGEADLDHRLLELLAVLGSGDGLGVGTDHFRGARHTDDAPLEQSHGGVQPGLATHRGQDCVGTFAFDDARHDLPGDRLDVGGISEIRVGHDGGRIGVHEDDPVALLTQHTAGLRAGVVELAGLTDDDGARADDEDRFDVGALGHVRQLPARVRSDRPTERRPGAVRPSARRTSRRGTSRRVAQARLRGGTAR